MSYWPTSVLEEFKAMRQWEYKTASLPKWENLQTRLNELGAEGWELVAVIAGDVSVAYLKRPCLAAITFAATSTGDTEKIKQAVADGMKQLGGYVD